MDIRVRRISLVIFILAFAAGVSYFVFRDTGTVVVAVSEDHGRADVAQSIGLALGWSSDERSELEEALRSIQWDALNIELADFMTERFSWESDEREAFLTRADEILRSEADILSRAYVPTEYRLKKSDSPAFIAEAIVSEIKKVNDSKEKLNEFFVERTVPDELELVDEFVKKSKGLSVSRTGSGNFSFARALLPDLTVLPPQDIALRYRDGRTLLVFGTTYYNIGDGPLELVGDPEDGNSEGDYEAVVFQRIHGESGAFLDEEIGLFDWHAEHSHYHFNNFIDYSLEFVSSGEIKVVRKNKSTYCVRDITAIDYKGTGEYVPEKYRSCGRDVQGVSVGWGDTYFHTFYGQNFDVTDLSDGIYRLSFSIDPAGMFEELSTDNNVSEALIDIDRKDGTVTVVEYGPKNIPEFKHIYPE